jgi:hypothetical protein
MAQIDRLRSAPARPHFGDCAALMQSQDLHSLEALRIHVRALEPYIGHLGPQQVHDVTLAAFVCAHRCWRVRDNDQSQPGGRAHDALSSRI